MEGSELSGDTCVRTNSAAWLPNSREILQQCRELSLRIRPELAEIILQLAMRGISISQLEGICPKATPIQPEEVRWHVLRLLKYHYLVLESPARGLID